MSNIEYLKQFFIKYHLDGKITVKYTGDTPDDEDMSNITFENGNCIKMNDVTFAIDSQLDPEVVKQWMELGKDKISLIEWIQSGDAYRFKDIDTKEMDEYKEEITELMEQVKDKINQTFSFQDSEEDED